MLWMLLSRFLFRLSFGLALCLTITSSREVTAGFFRVHLWVLLGLNTFSALAIGSSTETIQHGQLLLALAIAGGVLSYVGSVIWLYESRSVGAAVLAAVTLLMLIGATLTVDWSESLVLPNRLLRLLDTVSSGMLLGGALTAMLLGHWYLNTPTMKLRPLRQLLVFMFMVLVARTLVCAWADVESCLTWESVPHGSTLALLGVRWLPGIGGAFVTAAMAWRTLQIPNTQSATGILYVSVIFVFLGELASQLLSSGSPFLV
jgi:hypothetical protein